MDRRVRLAVRRRRGALLELLDSDPEAARVVLKPEALPDFLPDLIVGVDVERQPLRPRLARATPKLGEERLHHPAAAGLRAGARDVDVRLPSLCNLAEDEAGDLAVLLGNENELALQDLGPDLGPRPRPVPAHRLEQLEDGGRVSCCRLTNVHRGATIRPASR